ncbi:uncharacterized protein J3R85_018776 [Psidium guajava]|nr:uncharacterized protein J3R85_018776 [Psidium guajava]
MFFGHGSNVTCENFTADGKTICTGSDDATMGFHLMSATGQHVFGHYRHYGISL